MGCWCWAACSLGPGARQHAVRGAGGGAALRDWRPGARGHAGWVLVTAGCWAACSLGPGARQHVVRGAGKGAALRDWRPGARGHAVWGAGGCCFASLTVLAGIQLGLLVEVPPCKIGGRVLGVWGAGDGRVLGGM